MDSFVLQECYYASFVIPDDIMQLLFKSGELPRNPYTIPHEAFNLLRCKYTSKRTHRATIHGLVGQVSHVSSRQRKHMDLLTTPLVIALALCYLSCTIAESFSPFIPEKQLIDCLNLIIFDFPSGTDLACYGRHSVRRNQLLILHHQ